MFLSRFFLKVRCLFKVVFYLRYGHTLTTDPTLTKKTYLTHNTYFCFATNLKNKKTQRRQTRKTTYCTSSTDVFASPAHRSNTPLLARPGSSRNGISRGSGARSVEIRPAAAKAGRFFGLAPLMWGLAALKFDRPRPKLVGFLGSRRRCGGAQR